MFNPKKVIWELRALGTDLQRAQVIHVQSPLLSMAVEHMEKAISSIHGYMASDAYKELAKDVVNKALKRSSQETMFASDRDQIEQGVNERILGHKAGITEPEKEE